MKLSQPFIELLVDLLTSDVNDDGAAERAIRESPKKHLVSLLLTMKKETSEVGSTISFTLLDASMEANLERAEEFLQGELLVK